MKVILETDRLYLVEWDTEYAQDMFEYARDPRVGPMAGWPVHGSIETTRRVIEVHTAPMDLMFVLKETGKMIGAGGLVDEHYDWLPGKDNEIGYTLNPAYWGRGLVPEAMEEILRYGFEVLELDHVWCGYFLGNHNSCRVQEKLGFIPWGEPVERDIPLLGTTRMEQYSLLTRQAWERTRKG